MRPIAVRVGPLAPASANAIALSQAGTAATPLTLSGALAAPSTVLVPGMGPGTGFVTRTVATLDTPRRIGIMSSGNDSAIGFVLSGTDRAGQAISETVAGSNAGTAQSALDYATVTSVMPSGNTAGNVTVGTTSVASSAWARLDNEGAPQVSVQVNVSGTVTATLEQSLDNPNSMTDPVAPSAMTWLPNSDPATRNITQSIVAAYPEVPLFCRLTLTAGTGSAVARFAQAGAANPT